MYITIYASKPNSKFCCGFSATLYSALKATIFFSIIFTILKAHNVQIHPSRVLTSSHGSQKIEAQNFEDLHTKPFRIKIKH